MADRRKKQRLVLQREKEVSTPEDAALDAFDRMNKTTVAGFESESEIPRVTGTANKIPIPLYGYYGDAFFGAKASAELLEKEQKRFFKREDSFDDEIEILEKGLCEKYGITPPTKWPNRRKDRGTGGEQLLILGQTVNDRRHPKLWGIRQEDRTRHAYLLGPSGSGKAVPDNTPVLTKNGWKPIGELIVGDIVVTRFGTLTTVTGVFPQGKCKIWEIELADGQVIEANGDHNWIVIHNTHGTRRETVKTTAEMYAAGIQTTDNGFRNRIPLCSPINFETKEYDIPPYTLGCLIGDGSLLCASQNAISYSCAEQELLDLIIADLGNEYEMTKNSSNPEHNGYYIHEKSCQRKTRAPFLAKKIVELQLDERSEHKFVPKQYLWGDVEQRRELIQGLMDTDGCASKGRFTFTTISEQLRDDFCYLCRSLGYQVRIHLDYRPNKYKNTNGNCWEVEILSNDVENFFKLKRKKDDFYGYRTERKKNVVEVFKKSDPIIYDYVSRSPFSSDKIEDADSSYLVPYLAGMTAAFSSTTQAVQITEKVYRDFMEKRLRLLIPDIQIDHHCSPSQKNGKVNFWAEGPIEKNQRACNRLLHQKRFSDLNHPRSEQHIPEHYMKASLEDRLAFIQGMFDVRGKLVRKRLELYFKQQQMVDDMKEILESCGYTVTVGIANSSAGTKYVRVMNPDAGCISDPDIIKRIAKEFQVPVSVLFVGLPTGLWHDEEFDCLFDENKTLLNNKIPEEMFDGMRTNFNDGIAIVDIRPTDRCADMTCISVADESQSYLLENFIVTHNSTLLHAIGVEDMWYWRGGLLMEPHGDLALGLLRCAPPYRLHDIIYLDVLDPLASPGFNPLELPLDATDEMRQEATGTVTTLIAKHFNMDATHMPRLSKMLTNALNALSYVPGATILEIMDFYVNEDIRNAILSFVPDGPQKDAMTDLANNAKAEDLATLENRISRFTTNRFMRHLFGQSHTTMNFYQLMNEGKYIICPASKGGTSDDTFLKFYGSYIVSEVYKAAVMREAIEEGERVNFALTLDEFQNFMGDDIEGILAEARKYGLMMMLANQYLDQLTPPIRAAVLQNCATKLSYNLSPTDAKPMAQTFGSGLRPEDMQSIPKYHVMASPLVNGGNVRPFISAVFPPISLKSEVSGITANLIREISRDKYMKPRDDIDQEINDRKERLASGNKEAIRALMTKKNR